MSTGFDISETYAPDDAPPIDDDHTWFNAEYPHSTAEHPYGFFDKNGSPDFSRPRKNKPRSGGAPSPSGGVSTSAASQRSARAAAGLLSQMNMLVGISLITFGMPQTAMSLKEANSQFESMAYEALLNDPALCKKILSAGATSGKTQLIMAYGMLAMSLGPAAFVEIKERRNIVEGEFSG